MHNSTGNKRTAGLGKGAKDPYDFRVGNKANIPRPVISAPIGPVKNSRGADLTRGDTFTIVDGIKDCCSDESTTDVSISAAIKATRRISAGFNKGEPLAGNPTVARSDISATTTLRSSPKQISLSHMKKVTLMSAMKISNSQLKPRVALLYPNESENLPPAAEYGGISPPQRLQSKLPKSRTIGVLQDIKTSVSRPSLAARSNNCQHPCLTPSNTVFLTTDSSTTSRKTSASSTLSSMASVGSRRLRLPRTSLNSLARRSQSPAPEYQPTQITTAQPSAYWSGRFVALQDRFAMENLPIPSREPLSTSGNSSHLYHMNSINNAARSRPTHLSYSTTTMGLTNPAYLQKQDLEREEDDKHHRIFNHLRHLCVTSEARRSLYNWQQEFARRLNRPSLLPEGGSMERGLLWKFFGKRDRLSINPPRATFSKKLSDDYLFADASIVDGKRRTLY